VTDYEILLLLDAELPDERQQEIVSRARELIERGGGQFGSHDVWGRRKLAYEINRKADGTYHLLTFAAEPDVLDEVSRVLKITDGVLRHMAVRRPAAKRTVRKEAVQPPVREAAPAPSPAEPTEAEEAVSAARSEE
jgi:small subunit ribosomal protein S6